MSHLIVSDTGIADTSTSVCSMSSPQPSSPDKKLPLENDSETPENEEASSHEDEEVSKSALEQEDKDFLATGEQEEKERPKELDSSVSGNSDCGQEDKKRSESPNIASKNAGILATKKKFSVSESTTCRDEAEQVSANKKSYKNTFSQLPDKIWSMGYRTRGKEKQEQAASRRQRFSDIDTQNYRDGYPDREDDLEINSNLRFYMGEIPSSPDGDYIDNIHKEWYGNYPRLESHHGYIQWLFPIRENGMNYMAQPLQPHEAEKIRADPVARERVLKSYELMLNFFGMELLDRNTGELGRNYNWMNRFHNLNTSLHNYLRITRILKSLGELGFEQLKKNFIKFILQEAFEKKTLQRTLRSCRDYWVGTIKSDEDREELYEYIDRHDNGEVW